MKQSSFVEKIGTFVNIKNKNFYFKGCESCEGTCCNGAKGFALSPLILEDFEQVYKNFAIVFTLKNKKLRALVILNDGKSFCKYFINNKCSIYEQRTPACKLYPVAPYFDEILVDTSCPSINENEGKILCHSAKVSDDFFNERLNDFNTKLEKSYEFYESINDINNFKFIGHIRGVALLKYIKKTDNKYINMHLKSLVHYDMLKF